MINILLLIADDLGRMAGCYGAPAIRTPHIDRLARAGTRFDMAFTSTASCSASRSVIYTGLHTHETGQYGLHHDHHHFMTFADVETAPALLNAQAAITPASSARSMSARPRSIPGPPRRERHARCRLGGGTRRGRLFPGAAGRPSAVLPDHRLHRPAPGRNPQRVRQRPVSARRPGVFPRRCPGAAIPDRPAGGARENWRNTTARFTGWTVASAWCWMRSAAAGLADDTLVVFLSDNGAPFLNSKTTLLRCGRASAADHAQTGAAPGLANPNLVSFVPICCPPSSIWRAPPAPGRRAAGRCCRSWRQRPPARLGPRLSARTLSTR
jgi:N-sulfoglucosamine sulfohydrolase